MYCCRADQGLRDTHGVDHYKPKSQFPDLECAYGNLFYACNTCNRNKGPFWPSAAQLVAGLFIPNPCDHVMFAHLRYRGARVEARTVAGEWTCSLLDLNSPEATNLRESTLALLQSAASMKAANEKTLTDLIKLRTKGRVPRSIDQDISELRTNIAKLDAAIRLYSGG